MIIIIFFFFYDDHDHEVFSVQVSVLLLLEGGIFQFIVDKNVVS